VTSIPNSDGGAEYTQRMCRSTERIFRGWGEHVTSAQRHSKRGRRGWMVVTVARAWKAGSWMERLKSCHSRNRLRLAFQTDGSRYCDKQCGVLAVWMVFTDIECLRKVDSDSTPHHTCARGTSSHIAMPRLFPPPITHPQGNPCQLHAGI
jgi:hypothetical protein